ncbi:MAG: carboxypeptidase regulatory-like domain-containing protein [Elusimicrobiota bacterium]
MQKMINWLKNSPTKVGYKKRFIPDFSRLYFGFTTCYLLLATCYLFAAGTTGMQFLLIDPFAYSAATGGCGGALGDATNPAVCTGCGIYKKGVFGYSYTSWINGLSGHYFAFRKPNRYGTRGWGVEYSYFGLSEPYIDENFQKQKEIQFTNQILSFLYAIGNPSMGIGTRFKMAGSSIESSLTTEAHTSSAYTLDIGVFYVYNGILNFSFLKQNLVLGSAEGAYLPEKIEISQPINVGLSYSVYPLKIAAQADLNSVDKNIYKTGLEYILLDTIALRCGYKIGADLETYTAGIGLRVKDARFDYAWVPFGGLGDTHRVSIDFRYGTAVAKEETIDMPESVGTIKIKEKKVKIKGLRKPKKILPVEERSKLAVLDMFVQDTVTDAEADFIYDFLQGDLTNCEGFDIIERKYIDSIIKEQNIQLSGIIEEDTAFIKEFGGLIGVKYIIVSRLGKFGENYQFIVQIKDVTTGRNVFSVDEKCRKIEDMRGVVRNVVNTIVVEVVDKKQKEKKKKQAELKDINVIYVKVTDDNGVPLSNAVVKISKNSEEIKKILTDDNGKCNSDNLPLGTYTVKAWKQGYVFEEKEVEMVAENPTEVNFTLKKK